MPRAYQPTDTTALLEYREVLRNRSLKVLALSFLLLLLWALLTVLVVHRLIEGYGWAPYLGEDPLDGTLACLGNAPCRKALALAYPRFFLIPWWLPIPLVLLFWLVALILWGKAGTLRPGKLPGAARFREDWKVLLHGMSYLGIKGGHVLRYPKDSRFRHTFVLGSSGAGKTSRIIRPMLVHTAYEGRSAVVVDLKYPDLSLLSMVGVFEALGRDVIVLLPYDERSPRLPLLRGAEDPKVARRLAEVIIPVPERKDTTSYYENIERELLFWLIHIEALHGRGSLGDIRLKCQQGPKALQDYVKEKASDAESALGFFFGLAPSRQAEMVAGLVGKLSIFGDPLIDRMTSFGENEVDLRKITRKPTLLYLGIPQERLQDAGGQLFLQLFKRYLDWVLLEESMETGRLEVPVEVYLDEFTNLGYLPRMSDSLSTMRSRGVAYLLALQSFSQGLERYREEELESMLANCNTWIIFGQGLSDVDARRISQALGQATAYMPSESVSSPHILNFNELWPRYGETYRISEVPLLSPEEMRKLPEDQAVIRFSNADPLIATFPRLDEMARSKGIPKGLRRMAQEVLSLEERYLRLGKISLPMAAEYIVSRYLLPDAPSPQESPEAPQDPKEEIFSWTTEALLQGIPVTVHRDPNRPERITKLTLHPPAGLLPAQAGVWEKARYARTEKGRSVLSLVPPVLDEYLARHRGLVEYAEVIGRLRKWVDENAARLADHPLYGGGEPIGKWSGSSVVLPLDVLADLGIEPAKARALGQETRYRGKRGYVELWLNLAEWYTFSGAKPAQKGEEG